MTQSFPAMPQLPVAWGEVFDKLTILDIKIDRVADQSKLANIVRERDEILRVVGEPTRYPAALAALVDQLKAINIEIWDVEDGKRQAERAQRFDAAFIALARAVYIKNDRRAAIKRDINLLLGSALIEEKSHAAY